MIYNGATSDVSGLVIRPTNQEKFRATIGQRILEEVLVKSLEGYTFESSNAEQLSNSLSAIIRNRLKELNLPKYKYIIQVILGEEHGQRVRTTCFVKHQYSLYSTTNIPFMNTWNRKTPRENRNNLP
uniref:BMA-DYLT-2 n=1 Tax=Brugia malayi TaxID=6279 RepID=A0A0J9Y6M3_BRUMA|nr:BMA-DYLT-2 [Brugia malayi]